MPAGKRLLVALAVGAGLSLLLGAAWLARAGHPRAGLALGLATALAAVAALQALWVPFDLTGRSLRRGPRGARRVALTFDDGPSDDTPAVLDALERAGAKATFFVLGEAARRRPDLVREIARRGHEVALHGHTHAKLHAAGPARVARELDRCAAAIRDAGVGPSPLVPRAPRLPRPVPRAGAPRPRPHAGGLDSRRLRHRAPRRRGDRRARLPADAAGRDPAPARRLRHPGHRPAARPDRRGGAGESSRAGARAGTGW